MIKVLLWMIIDETNTTIFNYVYQEQQGGQLDLVATGIGGLLVAHKHFRPQRISRFLLVSLCNKVGLYLKCKNKLLDRY